MAGKVKSVHAGHRERMRKRFITNGNLNSFDDHEVLEMLLFYAYPMKNTNEIAHRLLEKYGSLYNLFNKPPQELINNGGLTENVAVLLSMMPYLHRRYLKSEFNSYSKINNSKNAKKFMTSLVVGQEYESFFVVSLDLKKRVIAVDELTDNCVDEVNVNNRIVIERALLNRAKFVIIGHNHPAGTVRPSDNDVKLTQSLITAYDLIGVTVIDHIIVCNKDTYSFYEHKMFNFTYNP